MAKELFVYSPYKSKFEEQVSSGAVDDSQIGIIAETGELWVKGTYLPIVDLSKKADISKGVITADGLKDSTDTTFFTPNRGLDPNTTLATQKYVAENIGKQLENYYTKTEVDPAIGKANSALQYITSPEPEEGDYVSISVGKKTGSNTQDVRVATHIAELNTSADGLVSASDARAYVEQAKAEVTENIGKEGFAKDLTGVIEATPEEFTYRPSAGDRSIRDASAVIRRIKGNTVVFAQLADFSNSLQREGDWSVAPEVTANTRGGFSKAVQVIAGHKYLFYINKKDGRSITDSYTLLKGAHRVEFDTPLFITAEETASWGWTALYKTSTNGLRFQTQAFDLTRLFDAGNEPTTIEEFKSKFPDSYYPYSEPEVRNVITNQITTIGFNQWDERWELGALATNTGEPVGHNERGRSVNFFDVVPNASYYCATIAPTTTNSGGTVGSMLVWWYDSSYAMIKYEDITNKIRVAPSNARYAKICTYGGDVNAIFNSGVNINLSHSKVRNGEYEPYKRNIRLLPEIYKYFPEGMNGNANVWDEINAEKAIKRWGVVDLGTLTWSAQGTNTDGVYRWQASGISTPPTATVSTIPNIICAKYTTGSNENTFARKDCVSISASGNIRIFDSNYKEASSKEAFVASLQGVLLYYELAKPIETPITEAIQLDYEVYDFGTEKASGFGNSAPFRADIVYQFNAEGRIRDNSRNIERVESNIQKVERTITSSLIPSQSAMLGLPNKVMIWNGSTAMMSLPIAEDIDHWDLEESKLGTIPTSQQVREYIKSVTDNLTPSQSATLESSNRVMVWNGDYAMTSLPIAANFAQWGAGAIPTGQQVIDYISAIKGSLATGLIPKETLTIGASGSPRILPNKAYEIITASNTNYNVVLKIETIEGVDAAADNEWRIRIDTRNGFSGSIVFNPLDGYLMRWAYSDVSGPLTAPNIKDGNIWDIQFRMIGRTLLGSYKKY